jgi:two-component system CheB/CheR fusion protein
VVITALRDRSGELRGFAKVTRDLTERRAAEESLRAAHAELEVRVEERTRELVTANRALREEMERRRLLDAERERLAGLLQQRVAELAAQDRHKNEFLAMLGHELRNPLAPIRNALEILRNPTTTGTMLEQARGMIDRQVHHLVRLVDDLLDVSRIMQGKIDLRRERLDLGTVVARAIETAQPAIEAQGHQLLVHLPGEAVRLDGDLVRLSQVLSNLLVNAAKYTLQAGIIELSAEREGQRVAIRVRDNGIGIAPELLPRVFDFFVQGQRSLARSQGGLGIGLTLVRRLVEMHGGEVRADSPGPGMGSVFTVWLPVVEGADGVSEDAVHPHEAREGCLRVLVVDDNVDAAESTAALLAIWGYETRIAHDGNSVLPAVRSFRPDVVLLDIGLPGRNGFEVARELRALPESPVRLLAAMTGYGQQEDRQRSAAAGFDLHLVKPLDPGQLRATLEGLCG